MSNLDPRAIQTAAEDEGRRLARLVFESRGNKGSLRLTENEFRSHIAVSFESGAHWALEHEPHK